MLQWGRDLSAAEREVSPDYDWGLYSFNGAATFRPRRDTGDRREVRLQHASMGPRPFGRGEVRETAGHETHKLASMGPRPFGRGEPLYTHPHTTHPRSFNGAATFRPRRGLSTFPWRWEFPASMGPRPFGRGERNVPGVASYRRARASMGPRPFGRGEAPGTSVGSKALIASMGPRPFGRGEPRRPRRL